MSFKVLVAVFPRVAIARSRTSSETTTMTANSAKARIVLNRRSLNRFSLGEVQPKNIFKLSWPSGLERAFGTRDMNWIPSLKAQK